MGAKEHIQASLDARDPLRSASDPVAYLRSALAHGRFALFCQPTLDLREDAQGSLAEVLVRMADEEQANLPPGDFLPVMQELGLLPDLDRWVLRQAVSRLVGAGGRHRLSINLSPQTYDWDFIAFAEREVRFAAVPAASVVFELPYESLGTPLARRFAKGLQDIGACIAIEDFPGDAAALEFVRKLRPDFVKVDGALVRKLRTSPEAKQRFIAAVEAASQVGAQVVAESVEDLQTLIAVIRLGAHRAQGYGVYPPRPLELMPGDSMSGSRTW